MVLRQRSDDGGARSQLTREWLRVGQLGLGPSTLVEDGAATPRIPLGRSVAEITTGVVSPQVPASSLGQKKGERQTTSNRHAPISFFFFRGKVGILFSLYKTKIESLVAQSIKLI
jgi:hypothetical protein